MAQAFDLAGITNTQEMGNGDVPLVHLFSAHTLQVRGPALKGGRVGRPHFFSLLCRRQDQGQWRVYSLGECQQPGVSFIGFQEIRIFEGIKRNSTADDKYAIFAGKAVDIELAILIGSDMYSAIPRF